MNLANGGRSWRKTSKTPSILSFVSCRCAVPNCLFPIPQNVRSSRHRHMRELRVQHAGEPYRILYAFDPRRSAILLMGGRKGGDDRWYLENVPIADRLYDEHVEQLRREGLINGA